MPIVVIRKVVHVDNSLGTFVSTNRGDQDPPRDKDFGKYPVHRWARIFADERNNAAFITLTERAKVPIVQEYFTKILPNKSIVPMCLLHTENIANTNVFFLQILIFLFILSNCD